MVVMGQEVKGIDVFGEWFVSGIKIGVSTWWGDNMMRELHDERTAWWENCMMRERNYKESIGWRDYMIRGLNNKRTRLYDKGITYWGNYIEYMMRGLHVRRLNDERTTWWEDDMMRGLYDDGTTCEETKWWVDYIMGGQYDEETTWWWCGDYMVRRLHD